jgi:hypothetical protein
LTAVFLARRNRATTWYVCACLLLIGHRDFPLSSIVEGYYDL